MSIGENLKIIRNQISEYEKTYGRETGSVKLMAVSKFHPVEKVFDAIENGQILFGENRVQEASEKFGKVFDKFSEIQMHIIGHLQKNKVKAACMCASSLDSVDSLELIKEIEKQCSKLDKKIEVLLELHTGEENKTGFVSEKEIDESLKYIADGNAPHVIPKGFMTMAPLTEDKALIEKSFMTLKTIKENMEKKYPSFDLKEISMGMSSDFELAVKNGSTMVRVGTAIFGEREY